MEKEQFDIIAANNAQEFVKLPQNFDGIILYIQ